MKAPPTAEAKTLEDSINVLAFKVAALLAVDPNGLGGACPWGSRIIAF